MGEKADVDKLLRTAAIQGDNDKVLQHLQGGALVNSHAQYKNTALHMAVFYGHAKVAQTLLNNGAKLDLTNANGQTPLQLAAVKGYLDIVKLMTSAGSNLHHKTSYSGMTALHFASKEGQADICQHLLDVGADEDLLDEVDQIAEYYAANYPTELVFKKWRQRKGKGKSGAANGQTQHTSAVSAKSDKGPEPNGVGDKQPRNDAAGKSESNQDKKEEADTTKPGDASLSSDRASQNGDGTSGATESNAPSQTGSSPDDGGGEAAGKDGKAPGSGAMAAAVIGAFAVKRGTTNEDDAKDGPTDDKRGRSSEKSTNGERDRSADAAKSRQPPNADEKYDRGYHSDGEGIKKGRETQEKDRKKFHYTSQERDKKGIFDEKRKETDRDKQKFGYKRGTGNWQRVKDHEFEWSEDYKKRQGQSVFDRLMGGKKK